MKITALETVHLAEFGNILFVRVLTDAGLEGLGETYYTPQTTTAFVHEVLAPLMLGRLKEHGIRPSPDRPMSWSPSASADGCPTRRSPSFVPPIFWGSGRIWPPWTAFWRT